MTAWKQVSTDAGHILAGVADVADGHLEIEEVWQNVYEGWTDDDRVLVGSVISLRTMWLNGCLVKDPGYAQKLWIEAAQS